MNFEAAVDFEWVVPHSASRQRREYLEDAGAKLQDGTTPFVSPPEQDSDYAEAAFEPLTVIVGLMGLVSLARQISSFIKDRHHDGLVVDARTEPICIRPHPSLDRGQLLVLTATGSQFFERDSGPDMAALLTAAKGR